MKLTEKPIVGFDNGIAITFKFPLEAKEELQATFDTIDNFSDEQDYNLSFTKAKKPRSMDANAYMWVLCDKIAKVIRATKEEVYRDAIKHTGVFSDVAVQSEACQTLVKSWGSNGIGYFSEIFDSGLVDKDGNPMKRVRLYEGSHNYDSVAMARVVDYVVDLAKTLNIQVLSQDKVKELEATWIK